MSKVKVKEVKDKDLAEMFNQMLGAGDNINMPIAYNKYKEIKANIESSLQILEFFLSTNFMKNEYFNVPFSEIQLFIKLSKEKIPFLFSMSFPDHDWNVNSLVELPKETQQQFAEIYNKLKQSQLVEQFIFFLDSITPHQFYITDDVDIYLSKYKYFVNMSSIDYCPFPFAPSFDLKEIFSTLSNDEKNNTNNIRLIMVVLFKLKVFCRKIFQLINDPDIDIDAFVEIMKNNIDEVKKHIPRCDKAFDKIINSISLLKSNFTTYYRDFIESKQSTIIMENFILDVSKNTKTDAETTRQFRKIITFYKSNAKNFSKNEKVKKLFDKLNENVSRLDKFENIKKNKEGGEENKEENEGEDEDNKESEEEENKTKTKIPIDTRTIDEMAADIDNM